MLDFFASSLVFPALVLTLMGWLVPKLYSLVFAEGVRPLMWLAFTSAVTMMGVGVLFFLSLYLLQGVPIGEVFEPGVMQGIMHFARLSAISAFFWGPIMILSVAGLPKHWVKEVW